MAEIAWKKIKGFERYSVSDHGEVRNDKTCRILKPETIKGGYLRVCLCQSGKMTHKLVARLVAETFIPNPESLPQVNHIDEDKTNNSVDNLEWVTASKNVNHGTRNERMLKKTRKPVAKINPETGDRTYYAGIREASRQTGVDNGRISEACYGKCRADRAGGYLWEFV